MISARVGEGLWIIDSSMCVATITGRPRWMQCLTILRWMIGSSSYGHSMPRSPRATMMPSAWSMIAARLRMPSWSSSFAMTFCGALR